MKTLLIILLVCWFAGCTATELTNVQQALQTTATTADLVSALTATVSAELAATSNNSSAATAAKLAQDLALLAQLSGTLANTLQPAVPPTTVPALRAVALTTPYSVAVQAGALHGELAEARAGNQNIETAQLAADLRALSRSTAVLAAQYAH